MRKGGKTWCGWGKSNHFLPLCFTHPPNHQGTHADAAALTILDLSDADTVWTPPPPGGLAAAAAAIAAAVAATPPPNALVIDSLAALADAAGGGDAPEFRSFLAGGVLGAASGGGVSFVAARTGGAPPAAPWPVELASCADAVIDVEPVRGGGGGDVAAVVTARKRCEAIWRGGGDTSDTGPLAGKWNARVVDAVVRLAERPL